jgi:hypothetical protein
MPMRAVAPGAGILSSLPPLRTNIRRSRTLCKIQVLLSLPIAFFPSLPLQILDLSIQYSVPNILIVDVFTKHNNNFPLSTATYSFYDELAFCCETNDLLYFGYAKFVFDLLVCGHFS